MMDKLNFILYPLALCLSLSCGGGSSEQSTDRHQDTSESMLEEKGERAAPNTIDEYLQERERLVKKVLEKQLREGAVIYDDVTDIPKEAFGTDELQAAIFEVKNLLWNNGHLEWENEKFAHKVKEIFGMTIPSDSSEMYRYVNLFDPCYTQPFYHRNNGIDYNGFFIAKPENLITEFYYLPELLDYQILYTDLAERENEFPKIGYQKEYSTPVEIEKWMEQEAINGKNSLKQQRKFNRLLTLNRNRFLFDGDDSRLSWLLQHDEFFMESLVKRFGWTNNENLLHWVLTETRFDKSNPDDFGSLFWKKNCDGAIKIHSNTFKMLQTIYAPSVASEVRFLLDDIQRYLEYVMGYQGYQPHLSITDEQSVEILANMVYFAEQYAYKKLDSGKPWSYHKMMGRLRLMLGDKGHTILKEKHYFGLPKFKEWWDAADYDEYYVDGEYNGPWGRDNEPLTEIEWRKTVEELRRK